MGIVTIPQKVTKGEELIVIPRKEYEDFLKFSKMISKDQLWFWTKEWQEKEKQADKDIQNNKVSPPHKTKKELRAALNGLKK